MSPPPRVSVIVPVYNVAGHVEACINSLLAQTWTDFELVVVDDGSTDGSGALAARAAGTDPRFRPIARENGGLSAARNTGLGAARGALIAFVDSDDRVAPDYLERLVTTLDATGADWVACGLRFVPVQGEAVAHPALHGQAATEGPESPARYDFTDWREIVRHFPSAWNKLYRRALIGEIRFDEGLDYEDHAFFYRLAERTDHLVHLHAPLYLCTQGRPGQITGDGGERVFDQIAVLDILRGILRASAKTGAAAALGRITPRLTFERAETLTDPDRRARFLAAARAAQAATGQAPDPALGVPAWWIDLLENRVPLSVVVPSDGRPDALDRTLGALGAQTLWGGECLVVPDGPGAETALSGRALPPRVRLLPAPAPQPEAETRVAAARNAGLAAAAGEAVVFLDADDTLPPRALAIWHNRLRRAGAALGFARFVMAPDSAHTGLHDRPGLGARMQAGTGFAPQGGDAVFIHAHPSAKIHDRAFLVDAGIVFPPGPLSSWRFLARALSAADRALYLPGPPAQIATRPAARRLWRAAHAAPALAEAVRALVTETRPALPPEAEARLLVRAIWQTRNFADFPDDAARAAFEAEAGAVFAPLRAQAGAIRPDAYVGARLRRLLDLPPASR